MADATFAVWARAGSAIIDLGLVLYRDATGAADGYLITRWAKKSQSCGVGTSAPLRTSISSHNKPMPSTGFILISFPKPAIPKGRPAVLAGRFASPVRGAMDGDDEGTVKGIVVAGILPVCGAGTLADAHTGVLGGRDQIKSTAATFHQVT